MPTYDDWRAKVKPLGKKRLRLPFNERVSEEEAARAKSGLLPESMDDKWAGFWLESEVAFCHSWTGQQIYSLPIKKSASGYEVGPLEVLDDIAVYRRSSDEVDVGLASRLLARLTKRNEKTA